MQKIFKYTLILNIIFASCKPNLIIPEKDMVSILVKIQIIDASVQNQLFRSTLFNKDTIDYYSNTIKSFGYTKAQFDSSLSFYSKKPKKLDAIYDNVILELSKIETKITTQNKNLDDSIANDTLKNLWPLQPQFEVPKDGAVNSVAFEIPVLGEGLYTVSADINIFPGDHSVKPTLTAYFFFDDKTPSGNISVLTTTELLKDGIIRNYKVNLELKNSLVTHLKGNILDHHNPDANFTKHAIANNIKITYKPNKRKVRKLHSEKLTQ